MPLASPEKKSAFRKWILSPARRVVTYLLCGYLLLCLAVYLFQRKLIYHPQRTPPLAPKDWGLDPATVRAISCTTSDGISLQGWQIQALNGPANRASTPQQTPLVILHFHGNGGHRGYGSELYRILATELGYSTVCLDYRGFGDSPGSPDEEGLARDAQAAWNWLVQTSHCPPQRIVLHGTSLGSAVALRLATEQIAAGTPPAGLILEAPFTSLPDAAARLYWFLPARWMLHDQFPSLERIPQLTCPLLILHGRRDLVVPFSQGRRLFEGAPENAADGTPKRFVELAASGHNDFRWTAAQTYREALQTFLQPISQKRDPAEDKDLKTEP